MNKVKRNSLKSELTYDNTTVLKYNIEYPEIIESNYKIGKDIFNQYNKNNAINLQKYCEIELFEEAKELYNYNKEHNYPIMVYEVFVKYEITYNNQYMISLYSDNYKFTGGAHGNTIRTSQNWDLRYGTRIPLSYFFKNDPSYIIEILKEINIQIQKQIQNGENQYFEDYCELVLQTFNLNNYYIYSQYIEVFFQQYDIAPYSSGIPTFIIYK